MAALSSIALAVGAAAAAKTAVDQRKAGKAQEAASKTAAEQNRQAAQAAAKSEREAAAQSARQQELAAQREAAQRAAEDAEGTKSGEKAEVNLGADEEGTVRAQARKRRQTFGLGSSGTGVNI